jgi:hypothetical protein
LIRRIWKVLMLQRHGSHCKETGYFHSVFISLYGARLEMKRLTASHAEGGIRMKSRILSLVLVLVALALPLSASQFVDLPFDQVARESKFIVRGEVIDTWAAWDDAREVIFTYATVRVTRYFGETSGPDTLVVREVGGTVDGYTQEAIGFPAIRRGEQIVAMLSEWEGSTDLRIHAFNQGKYLVRQRFGREILVQDPVKQGDERLAGERRRFDLSVDAAAEEENGLTISEFTSMVEDARSGVVARGPRIQR